MVLILWVFQVESAGGSISVPDKADTGETSVFFLDTVNPETSLRPEE